MADLLDKIRKGTGGLKKIETASQGESKPAGSERPNFMSDLQARIALDSAGLRKCTRVDVEKESTIEKVFSSPLAKQILDKSRSSSNDRPGRNSARTSFINEDFEQQVLEYNSERNKDARSIEGGEPAMLFDDESEFDTAWPMNTYPNNVSKNRRASCPAAPLTLLDELKTGFNLKKLKNTEKVKANEDLGVFSDPAFDKMLARRKVFIGSHDFYDELNREEWDS